MGACVSRPATEGDRSVATRPGAHYLLMEPTPVAVSTWSTGGDELDEVDL